jgi:hypothetical protein
MAGHDKEMTPVDFVAKAHSDFYCKIFVPNVLKLD